MDSKVKTDFFNNIKELASAKTLPPLDYFEKTLNKAISTLENERRYYRPSADDKSAGALLDFATEKNAALPALIVPDLHARTYFLFNILNFMLPSSFVCDSESEATSITVLDALMQKKLRIVCVGDLLHSEMRGRMRWIQAYSEFACGEYEGAAMTSEMMEGLSLLCMVLELKSEFPEYFHILKGNHENILNQTGGGDFAFCKFVDEGEMVRRFMESHYGDEILYLISIFEKSLPLVAAFQECVISHGEPSRPFLKKEIINGLKNADVVQGLTWTKNDCVQNGSVLALLKKLTRRKDFCETRYIGGHRPVCENYALRQNGLYIQIHNPERQNIALVHKGRTFNPDTDIVSVEKKL